MCELLLILILIFIDDLLLVDMFFFLRALVYNSCQDFSPKKEPLTQMAFFRGEVTAKRRQFKTKKEKAYSTRYSQAVTHPSTIPAQLSLTAVI